MKENINAWHSAINQIKGFPKGGLFDRRILLFRTPEINGNS